MSTEGSATPARLPLLALACGMTAANLYYAQPLAGPISMAIGLPTGAAGLIVTGSDQDKADFLS